MWTPALTEAYEAASPEEQAGFVAYLLALAPGSPVAPHLRPALDRFATLARIEPGLSIETSRDRAKQFFETHPMSPRLRLAFEEFSRGHALARTSATEPERGAKWLGAEIPRTAPSGVSRRAAVSSLLAIRSRHTSFNRD